MLRRDTRASAVGTSTTLAGFLAAALLLAVGVVVYAPLIVGAGFTYDDFYVCDLADAYPGLWPTAEQWYAWYSFRPLAPLVLSALANTFHWRAPGYMLTTLVIWALIGVLVGIPFARHCGRSFAIVFLLLFGFPSMSCYILFNAGTMTICTVAFALWSVSFWLVDRSTRTSQPVGYLVPAHLLVAAAMLIYEAFLPLLVVSTLWPAATAADDGRRWWRRIDRIYVVRYVAPPLTILVLTMLYQKAILPHFAISESRFSFSPLNSVASAGSWLFAVAVEYPALLFEAVLFTGTAVRSVWMALLLVALLLGLGWLVRADESATQGQNVALVRKNLLAVAGLCALGGSLLFLLSGRPAMVWGGSNRAMAPTWVGISLFLAVLISVQPLRRWRRALVATVIVLNLLSFLVQRNNYMTAWVLQDEVLDALAGAANDANVPTGSLVLGCVPNHLTDGYNLEMVLVGKSDFGISARRYTGGRIAGGSVFYANGLERVRERAAAAGNPDDLPALVKLYEIDLDASQGPLWYFEFDQETKASRLLPVRDASHLRELVDHIVEHGVNRNREPVVKRYYDRLRDVVKPLVRGSATAPPS